MSKINKIRLSGTTYDIEDSGATRTVEVTQAEYDALVSGGTVDPNTFYVITDATAVDISQYWTSAETQSAITEATSGKVDASTYETYTAATDTALSGKQDTLSAGTNITIVDNVISAEGGSITVDPSLDSGSTNAVANSAITEALEGKLDASAYTPTDLSEYWTSAQTNSAINAATSGKVNTNDVYTRNQSNVRYISGASVTTGTTYDRLYIKKGDGFTSTVGAYFGKINGEAFIGSSSSNVKNFELAETSALTEHTSDSTIHVTSSQTAAWDAKSNFSGSYNDLTDKPTIPTSASQLTNDEGYITSDALSGYAESSAVTEEIAAAVSGKADTSAVTDSINAATSGKVDTTTFETYSGSVETALSGKQDTLSAGTNITIVDNVISAEGGGGKAIEAGRGIAITTRESADTISLGKPLFLDEKSSNLQIDAEFNGSNTISQTGSNSNLVIGVQNNVGTYASHNIVCGQGNTKGYSNGIIVGSSNQIKEAYSQAFGYQNITYGEYNTVFGTNNETRNYHEFALGRYNKSNSGSTDSDRTLFSVGNGTDARHNAFEIRKNGDIYIEKGGSDVKLQDIIPSTTSAVTSGSTAVVESGAVYDQLGGMKIVKLTESEYTALVTKDSNTLYVVVADA